MILDTLNEEQRAVVLALKEFVSNSELDGACEVLVSGPAGTGKTYCMKALVEVTKKRIVFTAPTNKAVRVLRDAIKSSDYSPTCRTIYSLLGLQLAANGEIKELMAPEDPVDLSEVGVIVVDEGSMVNSLLNEHITMAKLEHPHIKWIFMGDEYQLPPVGEDRSPIWSIEQHHRLKTIMRHDNTILQLAGLLRDRVEFPLKPLGNVVSTEDVHWLSNLDFQHHMRDNAAKFLRGEAKAIAWRNVKVDQMNAMIRKQLFAEHDKYPWQPGDRITTEEPFKDPTDEKRKRTLTVTSDEGTVERAELAPHPKYPEFSCWRILFRKDDNQLVTLWALHLSEQGKFEREKAARAAAARANRRLWFQFWEFLEAFAKVRHAYAITAHKSQGSTYYRAYVNWRDILLNDNRVEAYKCLYVAVTRARKDVYLG